MVAPQQRVALTRVTSARPAAARWHRHRPAVPWVTMRPYLIYDSVFARAIPAHQKVATYVTGRYAVAASQVAGRCCG